MADVFKRPALPLVPVLNGFFFINKKNIIFLFIIFLDSKRARFDSKEGGAIVLAQTQNQNELPRSSKLQTPNMLLTGHGGEIYGAKFSPDGNCLASVGYDMKIC